MKCEKLCILFCKIRNYKCFRKQTDNKPYEFRFQQLLKCILNKESDYKNNKELKSCVDFTWFTSKFYLIFITLPYTVIRYFLMKILLDLRIQKNETKEIWENIKTNLKQKTEQNQNTDFIRPNICVCFK